MMTMRKVSARIYGIVQHVGYRNFVRGSARKLGVTGWVKNNFDGSVEAIFEGADQAVNELIERCKTGPMLAMVEKVDIVDQEPQKEFEEFVVLK